MASLAEFLEKTGNQRRIVDEYTTKAYEDIERQIWLNDEGSSPHGHPWHTSFHASRFPNPDAENCSRAPLYELMNLPEPAPTSRWLRQLGDAGKALEENLVWRWHKAGYLISPPPTEPIQLGAQDDISWLTCSFDSVWALDNRPFPVEVKSKGIEKVREMIYNRTPEEKHVRQLKVQMAFLYLEGETWWPELDPIEAGALYYIARDDPMVNTEFRIKLDMDFVARGVEILKEWKENFLNDELPHLSDKKHPLGEHWRWSEGPCRFCPFKKDVCKPDWKDKITKLSESHGTDFATGIRQGYSADATRRAVIDRWSGNSVSDPDKG